MRIYNPSWVVEQLYSDWKIRNSIGKYNSFTVTAGCANYILATEEKKKKAVQEKN